LHQVPFCQGYSSLGSLIFQVAPNATDLPGELVQKIIHPADQDTQQYKGPHKTY
jgi:hypothetical protein